MPYASSRRGPRRPGLSHHWVEDDSEERLKRQPSIQEDFGLDWLKEVPEDWHCGCACRSLDGLLAWFTPRERMNLEGMGYRPVSISADRILRENDQQLVFARQMPLNKGVVYLPWRIAA